MTKKVYVSVDVDIPVTILHGLDDDVVPYQRSLQLAAALTSDRVDVILRKNGDHRLSREEDLALLTEHLDKLVQRA